jgi:putative chitinase
MFDHAKFCAALTHAPALNLRTDQKAKRALAILSAWEKYVPNADIRWIAYSLATALWETEWTLMPIREIGLGRGHAYGLPAGPWHQVYYGRGFDQMTWEANYAHATTELRKAGMIGPTDDLVKTPDLALRPDIAAAVLILGMEQGWFTGKRLSQFFYGTHEDALHAREIINGLDKASQIAGLYAHFKQALTVALNKAPPAKAA